MYHTWFKRWSNALDLPALPFISPQEAALRCKSLRLPANPLRLKTLLRNLRQ